MNCTVENCTEAATITAPLPLCMLDSLRIMSAYVEAATAGATAEPERPDMAEVEISRLYELIDHEGWQTVNLKRAMAELGKLERTAARRLAAARSRYAADIRKRAETATAESVSGMGPKRQQMEEATFEAAVLLACGNAPTRREFADRYGRSETWGRERYADAERLTSENPEFAARVQTEAQHRTR